MKKEKPSPSHWFRHGGDMPSRRGSLLESFNNEIDRMLDHMYSTSGAMQNSNPRPRLDVRAEEKAYSISVELPGVDEKDVFVELDDGVLIISGEKKHEHEQTEDDFRRERHYGSFVRRLVLADDAESEGITARFKQGVLTITVPRNMSRNRKRIPINSEAD